MAQRRDRDVLEVLRDGHREIERIIAAFDGSTDTGQRGRLVKRLIAELAQHSVAEQEHLSPTVLRALPDGDRLVREEIERYSAAEQTMSVLDKAEPGDSGFDDDVRTLVAQIREHVAEQENSLFPRLKDALSDEQRARLGERVLRAKRTAPTHPHPRIPGRPPFSKAVTPAAGLVDRVRDWLSGRGR